MNRAEMGDNKVVGIGSQCSGIARLLDADSRLKGGEVEVT